MTDNEELRNEPVDESVQAVVDRVLSYQGGAEVEVVRQELQDGLTQICA